MQQRWIYWPSPASRSMGPSLVAVAFCVLVGAACETVRYRHSADLAADDDSVAGDSRGGDPATGDAPGNGPGDPSPSGDPRDDGDAGDSEVPGDEDASLLDPNLVLPDASGQPCGVGGYDDCPFLQVCRIFGPGEGRCEGCTNCGNLNALCSDSTQCDILFQCYQGRCTNICPLGTYYCGPIEDCIDVGHESYGVCRPWPYN